MVALGFLNWNNAPTEKAKSALPSELQCPSQEVLDKTVVLFHDESTFQANENQSTFWGTKGTTLIKPKSKGSGLWSLKNGYLCLTQDEYRRAHEQDPTIQIKVRTLFEYGDAKEQWRSQTGHRPTIQVSCLEYNKGVS